jgi:CHAD domain-containing protein
MNKPLFDHTPDPAHQWNQTQPENLTRPGTLQAQSIHWLRTHAVSLGHELETTRNDLSDKGPALAQAVEALRKVLGK